MKPNPPPRLPRAEAAGAYVLYPTGSPRPFRHFARHDGREWQRRYCWTHTPARRRGLLSALRSVLLFANKLQSIRPESLSKLPRPAVGTPYLEYPAADRDRLPAPRQNLPRARPIFRTLHPRRSTRRPEICPGVLA